ncbi:LINE-1 retrotransposable element ORF1 protein [Dissostichus eleginoides]|uniref:LINE-1 retrotransposable element ORF1 protein n=1 Tax=Dissostichus eleginoides TaxID=100907 RepID=A0AAD9B4M5_DISEL|nr:LINE-1 retrotransposable element ORF1 protein [Dissostichus eleginoides]
MSSSTRNKAPNKQDISKEKNDKQRRPASPASASLKTDSNTCEPDHEVTLLDELGKLRKENQEGHNQTKMSLDRLEQTVLDIKVQMGEHEGRIGKLEDSVGMAEDVAVRHRRALRYLIHRDMALSATCDDLQNRLRRNNVRIFQDYSPELHKKRAKVHEVIKQLKKKDILARCIYPAQLKLKLGTGEKTYTTLSSAAEVLKTWESKCAAEKENARRMS